jgi:hypothetical protein
VSIELGLVGAVPLRNEFRRIVIRVPLLNTTVERAMWAYPLSINSEYERSQKC